MRGKNGFCRSKTVKNGRLKGIMLQNVEKHQKKKQTRLRSNLYIIKDLYEKVEWKNP